MPPISAKRKIDAVLTVCQNNQTQSVEIKAANKAAARLTGIDTQTLEKTPFTDILPDTLKEIIESTVEFDAQGMNDLASVLRKSLHFAIKQSNGKEVPVSLKVFYVLSEDANPCYELLMRDITLTKQLEALKQQALENQSHVHDVDQKTGLAGRETINASLNMVEQFMQGPGYIEATFVAIEIDKMEKLKKKYGDETQSHIIKQVGGLLRKACREEDTVALLNEHTINLILLDCNEEDAMQVLNRYRLQVNDSNVSPTAENLNKTLHITASFGFKEIKNGDDINSLISVSHEELEKAKEEGGNRVFGQ